MEASGQILTIIRKVIRSLNLESKRINKEYGITIPQLFTLKHLQSCSDYQASHKEITSILELNSSTVTGIIDRLEKKNLVARLPKKEDKRVTYIALTAKGSSLLKKSPKLLQQKLPDKLDKMKKEDVEQLTKSLNLLANLLELKDIEASPILTTEEPLHHNASKNQESE